MIAQMPVCIGAIDLGILDSSIAKPNPQNRPEVRRIWKDQVSIFQDKEYSYRVNPIYLGFSGSVNRLTVLFY